MGTPADQTSKSSNLIFSINKTLENLIQKIEPLTHQKGKDINISQLLNEFYETVVQSELYLQNGVLTINFGKAAIFLDYAFCIYSKQVDLLWQMAIDSQRRFLSYDEDSPEKAEAEVRLEEKANKGKRGPKKKQKPVINCDLKKFAVDFRNCMEKFKQFDGHNFEFENERSLLEIDTTIQRRLDQLRRTKIIRKKYPDKYLIKPYVETSFNIKYDEDCRFNNQSLFTNRMEFLFPEIERKFQYNYGDKRNIQVIGCDVTDTAFQHYITEKAINPMELTLESYKDFQKYRDNYLIHGPQQATLVEQQKKLCPRRTSILLTRLPENVVQKYLKLDETLNADDSGFDNGAQDFPLDVPETNIVHCMPKTKKTEDHIERRTSKRKSVNVLVETPQKKLRKRSEVFKWLKNTTADLKKFERFFCKTYLTDEGEGDIPHQEFSSDDEDNGSQTLPMETTESNLNRTADSGFFESFNSSQTSSVETTTQEASISTDTGPPPEKSEWELQQEALNDIQKRFYEWNDYIREELKKYTNCDFDIHEYGSKIIDCFETEKSTIRFDDAIQGDSSSEIARFFAATLQLTNSENIELSNWTEGELATDLKLTLLSKERHHEHLGDYKAPSLDTKETNVERIKNLNSETRDDFLKKIERERHGQAGTSGFRKIKSYKRVKVG